MDRRAFIAVVGRCILAAPFVAEAPADFLWFMSSDYSLTPPQLLARHRCQVVLLVIRDLAFPHDEDDRQPFGAQRPERLAVRVSPRALLIVVRAAPLTREQ